MTVIIDGSNISKPRIGYVNLLESAITTSATSEAEGFEKENAYDWRLDDWWKPETTGTHYLTAAYSAAVHADYFAVFGHDLHTYNASVKLQYSTDGGANWSDATDYVSPARGLVIFRSFDRIGAHRWRVVLLSASGPASIGMIAFGESLQIPRQFGTGFTPPNLARKNEIMGQQAEKGAFLGQSVRRNGVKFSIQRDVLEPGWVREEWEPFMDHAETKPFFFSWDYENHPWEAAYCWMQGSSQAPDYHHPLYMQIRMSLVGQTIL